MKTKREAQGQWAQQQKILEEKDHQKKRSKQQSQTEQRRRRARLDACPGTGLREWLEAASITAARSSAP